MGNQPPWAFVTLGVKRWFQPGKTQLPSHTWSLPPPVSDECDPDPCAVLAGVHQPCRDVVLWEPDTAPRLCPPPSVPLPLLPLLTATHPTVPSDLIPSKERSHPPSFWWCFPFGLGAVGLEAALRQEGGWCGAGARRQDPTSLLFDCWS